MTQRAHDVRQALAVFQSSAIDLHSLPRFQHRPLDLSRPQIRLLNVLPREGRSEIRCNIKHVLLPGPEDKLEYTALSYAWGEADGLRYPLVIDGQSYGVLANLYNFLDLHSADGIPNLFVDAICIAQDNIIEKNHQVLLMREIYRKASSVIVWLGPAADGSDTLFDSLADFTVFEIQDSDRSHIISSKTNPELRRWLAKETSRLVQPTTEICERKYWTRAWIIQEIILARRAELICGRKKVSWPAWIAYLDTIAGLDKRLANPSGADLNGHFALAIRDSMMHSVCEQWISTWQLMKKMTLTSLMTKFAKSECLKTHDKVYAFLGLASDADSFPIDYNTPIEIIMMDLLLKPSWSLHVVWDNCPPAARRMNEILSLCRRLCVSPARLTTCIDIRMQKHPQHWLTFGPSLLKSDLMVRSESNNLSAGFWSYSDLGRKSHSLEIIPSGKLGVRDLRGLWRSEFDFSKIDYYLSLPRRVLEWPQLCLCSRCQSIGPSYADELLNPRLPPVQIAVRTEMASPIRQHIFAQLFRGTRYLASGTGSLSRKQNDNEWDVDSPLTLFYDPDYPSITGNWSTVWNKCGSTPRIILPSVNMLAHLVRDFSNDTTKSTGDIVGRPKVPVHHLLKAYETAGTCVPPQDVPLGKYAEYFRKVLAEEASAISPCNKFLCELDQTIGCQNCHVARRVWQEAFDHLKLREF